MRARNQEPTLRQRQTSKDSIDVADGLVAAHRQLSNVFYVTPEYVKCADRKKTRHIVKYAILAKNGDIVSG